MSGVLDGIVAWSAKHERLIEIVGAVWFVVSWAHYAEFIDLPEIPLLTDSSAIFLSTAVNGLWWSALRPMIERRKAALLETNSRAANG